MRLLQNIVITHNARFFESLFLSWNTSLIVSEYVCHQKMFVRKCLLSLVSGQYTFNPSSLSLKSVMIWLQQQHGEWDVLQNYQHGKGKGFREETIYFHLFFRLNIVLRDLYQSDEIVMESEEWKQKVPGDHVKSFSRV